MTLRLAQWLVFFLVTAVSACAEPNAVLEVRMNLRPVDGRNVTRVQVGTVNDAFEDTWAMETHSFELESIEDGCNVSFSVEAPTPRTDRAVIEELRLKIWFCDASTPDCADDSGAPLWRVTLERPLYPGERTTWVLAGPEGTSGCMARTQGSTIATTTRNLDLRVDRCEIFGCLEEGSVAAAGRDFCEDESRTRHPCD